MLSKVITTTQEFYSLEEDWERLQEQDPDVTYYSTFEFAKAWWDAYKNDQDKELFIVCIYQGKDIVGIGPFIIQKEKKKIISCNTLRFLGRGDFLGVLVDRDKNNEMTIIKDMFKSIEDNKEKWERIQLTHIKGNCMLGSYLFKQIKYNNKFHYLIECPQLNFNKYNGFEEYRNKYITSSAKRYRNKLKREHNYIFKVVKNTKKNNVFDEISRLHRINQEYLIKEQGRTDRRSLYNDEKTNKYLEDIYNNSNNIITFMLMDEANNVITYYTCYLYKKVLHFWNTAYDPNYLKYNVGKIINYEIMQYVFETNIADKFDFGAGRYPWKFKWTNDFVLDYQLDVWNEDTKKGNKLQKLFKLKKKLIK